MYNLSSASSGGQLLYGRGIVRKAYDVACIGNYTKDTIVSPSGRRHADGGAVNYAVHALARMNLDVAVVTHLSIDDRHVVDRFEQLGVDSSWIRYTPHSTLMMLEYPGQNVDERNLYVASSAGPITPDDVKELVAKAMVIGTSMRSELGLDTVKALRKKDTIIAADIQGFLRVLQDGKLVHQPWPTMEETLAHIDILKADGKEAEFLTGEGDVEKAAVVLAEMGPREVLITHRDGVLLYTENRGKQVEFYPNRIVGRSGRGDTCLGSYTGKRLSASPDEALVWAAALTSLKMEHEGPFCQDIRQVGELVREKYQDLEQGAG